MQTHAAKKIEIVAEAVRMRLVLQALERLGATGYTVVPVIAGKGRHGVREAGDPSDVNRSVMIVVIARASVADAVMAAADDILQDHTAIICVSDVAVRRADHF